MSPLNPIGNWLRETRLRQRMPNGEPWTQDYLIERMQESAGWAPHRPNLSKWETGQTIPKGPTLAKFVAFWAGLGEPGPDLNPVAPPIVEDPLVAAVREQTAAIREQTAMLREVLLALGGASGGGSGVDLDAAALSGVEEGVRRARQPRTLPTPERPARSQSRPPLDISVARV